MLLTGGTIARLAAQGHRVIIVVACDGAARTGRQGRPAAALVPPADPTNSRATLLLALVSSAGVSWSLAGNQRAGGAVETSSGEGRGKVPRTPLTETGLAKEQT